MIVAIINIWKQLLIQGCSLWKVTHKTCLSEYFSCFLVQFLGRIFHLATGLLQRLKVILHDHFEFIPKPLCKDCWLAVMVNTPKLPWVFANNAGALGKHFVLYIFQSLWLNAEWSVNEVGKGISNVSKVIATLALVIVITWKTAKTWSKKAKIGINSVIQSVEVESCYIHVYLCETNISNKLSHLLLKTSYRI